jgi:hypothetical protein
MREKEMAGATCRTRMVALVAAPIPNQAAVAARSIPSNQARIMRYSSLVSIVASVSNSCEYAMKNGWGCIEVGEAPDNPHWYLRRPGNKTRIPQKNIDFTEK